MYQTRWKKLNIYERIEEPKNGLVSLVIKARF